MAALDICVSQLSLCIQWFLNRVLKAVIHMHWFHQVVNVKGQSVLLVSLETIFWFLWNQLEGALQAYDFSPPACGKT